MTGKQKHDEATTAYRLSQPCPVVCAYCGTRFEGTAAKPGPGQIALCRKHADIYATSILTEYAPLIWALQWTGKDSA